MPSFTRRRFVQNGLVSLSIPSFLLGCAKGSADRVVTPATAAIPANPFRDWFDIDEAVVRRVMAELTAHGADHAELYFQHERGTSIHYRDGLVSQATTSVDLGVGLRVVVGDQVGFAYSEDLSQDAMLATARAAAAIARGHAKAIPERFVARERGTFYELDVPWSEVGLQAKIERIRLAAKLAHQADPAIEKVRVSWDDSDGRVLIADLRGNMVIDERPMARLSVSTTAIKGGETQSGGYALAGRHELGWFSDSKIRELVDKAVARTMILFDARQPPAGEMPVVLAAGASGILLHEAIGHGMEADFNRKNESIYSEMLGRKVAADFVTIVDDGTLPNERGALNYDDEGTPCERTVLVENGVLSSYLHDRISAAHYRRPASTGSGRRQSFRHIPIPRMRATYMLNGPHSREEIIGSVKRGILAETFTNGQVNIGPGDFTFYVKNGWMIEDGKITAPIRDCNIIGNGPQMLKKITMVANDLALDEGGWTCGKRGQGVPVSQGLPTALVSNMTVGGIHA
jgi:TldD protein